MTGTDDTDRRALEMAGSTALDRFIETFNSRDPEAWAATLSYPHVRVSPSRRSATSSPTAQHYADAVNYDTADAMGWHHSSWDHKWILAVSPDKIHASAQWCRYDHQGERILPNNVSYVITNIDGRWGIQARFGVDSPAPVQPTAVGDDATSAWSEWWTALATGNDGGLASRSRFPFHVVGTGVAHELDVPADLQRQFAEVARATTASRPTPLQIGERGVNLGVSLTGNDGRTRHGLFLITIEDTAVRVAAASLLESI